MPGLPKDRPAGRLGRLISALRPARAGPLPVQTGFPTSLADLFVKNHGRLRKPSSASRRKKRGAPPLPTPPPSPAPSPPASSPPSPPAAASPPAQPTPDLPPVEPVCQTGGGGGDGSAFGLGLGFLALVGVVSLALLVIWSRKVVAAVTVAAFSLVLLESARSFSLTRRPRAPAAKEAPDLGGRGYVSPIREAEPEPEPPGRSCSDLGRGTGAFPVLPAEDTVEERSDDGSNPKAKSKKRSWKKLIPRKLQRGGRACGEADSPSVSSFRSEGSDADAALLVGGNAGASDLSDSRRGSSSSSSSRRHQADAVTDSSDSSCSRHGTGTGTGTDDAEARDGGPIEADASADLAGVDGVGGSRVPFVAAVVVVLVGLVAGRLPAVAVTVLFSAAVSSLQRLSAELKGGA